MPPSRGFPVKSFNFFAALHAATREPAKMALIYHARSQYMFLFSEYSLKCIHTRIHTYTLAWDAPLRSGFESFRGRKELRMIEIGDKRSRYYDKNSLYRCFINMSKAFRTNTPLKHRRPSGCTQVDTRRAEIASWFDDSIKQFVLKAFKVPVELGY